MTEQLAKRCESEGASCDPEPMLHSEHLLRITQLNYLRLRSWLLAEIRAREANAKAYEEKANGDARFLTLAAHERAEASHVQRIADGLECGWKPGRAPGDIGRGCQRRSTAG